MADQFSALPLSENCITGCPGKKAGPRNIPDIFEKRDDDVNYSLLSTYLFP